MSKYVSITIALILLTIYSCKKTDSSGANNKPKADFTFTILNRKH